MKRIMMLLIVALAIIVGASVVSAADADSGSNGQLLSLHDGYMIMPDLDVHDSEVTIPHNHDGPRVTAFDFEHDDSNPGGAIWEPDLYADFHYDEASSNPGGAI